MATQSEGGGGSAWLAFVVGALLVVVAGLGYMMFTGHNARLADNGGVNIQVRAPATPRLPPPPVAPPRTAASN